jgi:hypothetical protein
VNLEILNPIYGPQKRDCISECVDLDCGDMSALSTSSAGSGSASA